MKNAKDVAQEMMERYKLDFIILYNHFSNGACWVEIVLLEFIEKCEDLVWVLDYCNARTKTSPIFKKQREKGKTKCTDILYEETPRWLSFVLFFADNFFKAFYASFKRY